MYKAHAFSTFFNFAPPYACIMGIIVIPHLLFCRMEKKGKGVPRGKIGKTGVVLEQRWECEENDTLS